MSDSDAQTPQEGTVTTTPVEAAPPTATPVADTNTGQDDPRKTDDPRNRAVALPDARQVQDMPLGWAKSLLLTRAGVPFTARDADGKRVLPPLRAGLSHTHASEKSEPNKNIAVKRVPPEFQWTTGPKTVGEALDALDAAAILAGS